MIGPSAGFRAVVVRVEAPCVCHRADRVHRRFRGLVLMKAGDATCAAAVRVIAV